MARIRTVKPEFFTSEDIVKLSPLARLLFIALWCEADRQGRMEWKPKTFKIRYLPADSCDIEALCAELLERKLVRLYGASLAYIPTFSLHQQINNRETESRFPDPKTIVDLTRGPRVTDASLTSESGDTDAHEGKGKEGKGREGKDSSNELSDQPAVGAPDCPQQQIIATYHRILPNLPPVNEWTAQNAENLRTRWRSAPDRQAIAWWENFFEYVKKCPFLVGQKTDFQASLGWLVKSANFAKVLNGNYEQRAS